MSLKWRGAGKPGADDSDQCTDSRRNVAGEVSPVRLGPADPEQKNHTEEFDNDSGVADTIDVPSSAQSESVLPSSRAQLEADIVRVETEMMQAGSARDFAGAMEKEQELNRLIQLREQLPSTSDLLEQLNQANSQLDAAIKERQWQQAKSLQELLVKLERQLAMERDAESTTTAPQREGLSSRTLAETSLPPSSISLPPKRQYSHASSSSIRLSGTILTDCLTVFLSAPLVWMDSNGTFHPFPLLDFQQEKKLLAEALKDAHDIGAEIVVRYEPATTDRLAAFLAADPSPVLHFSGHGHAEYLAIENEGAMQALGVNQLREFIAAGSGQLKVVFVSACHSKPAGQAFLEAGVPHVVCCKQSEQLRDTAAIEFARNFYRALACGKSLRESFQLARQTVMVSPTVVDAHLEMEKFLLLPEKAEDDPYHDVQVFYARPLRNRSVSSYFSASTPTILPSPPDVFIGREMLMYKLVKCVKESRLVQIVGPSGSGKCALAAAVCRYIHDRTRSFFLDDVFWFAPSDMPYDENELSTGFHELFTCVGKKENHALSKKQCCKKIINSLVDMRALIFIDARELNSSSELENMDASVQEVLRHTEDVKVVFVCPSGLKTSSPTLARAVQLALPPLDFHSSVLLFGNLCSFVSKGQAVQSPDDLVELLVPDTQADATTISSTMSKRSCDIFQLVGDGIPGQIHAAATNMTREQYGELLRIGERQEPRAQINSRVELENEISRLAGEVESAVSACDFGRAQERQDMLEELQSLRENLPSLEELKQMETKLRKELNSAISSKSFTQAEQIQKSLNELIARKRTEEEARLLVSSTVGSTSTSVVVETHAQTAPISSPNDTETTNTNEAEDAAPLHRGTKVERDPLKNILDPLRDLDDTLISEQMERFAPGTREWAVRNFDSWLSSEKERHRIFVLVAQAGVGKTGIVCKLARERSDVVVGYHFCRHDDSRRNNPKNMILSLAYQIAQRFPEYRASLDSIVTERWLSREELVKDHNVVALFELLLREPLAKLTVDKRHAILIDALDECEGKNEILLCIQRHFTKLPPWLCVFATARPEFPIMDRLKKFNPMMIEPQVEENIDDLRVFFGRLLDDYGVEELSQGPSREEAITTLIEKSGGLFIYASFLADMFHSNGLRNLTLEALEEFPQGLDEFYDVQFTRIFPDKECLEWRSLKAVVAAAEPLHVDVIQAFLQCTRDERMTVIRRLSEFFPIDQNRTVYVYHKSLTDWLTSDERQDSEFFVDLLEEEKFLAIRCLEILTEFGIVGNKCTDEIDMQNPEVMKYALRHGISHLCTAGMRHEARKLVLNVRWLLARVEAGDAYEIILDCQMLEKGDRVVELVGRAIGLSLNAIRADPHHLPGQLVGRLLGSTIGRKQDDIVRQELSDFIDSVKDFRYGFKWWCPVQPSWDQAEQPCLRTLIGHTSGVRSVKFAEDTTKIVSASNDHTVRIWDALTGHCDHLLEGHRGCVHSIALLEPNGTKIASASEDRTVRVWDASSCECSHILEEYGTGKLYAVAWFAGGRRLITGSGDCTVRIWNVAKEDCEKVFRGHRRVVVSVALSPDQKHAVSGSFDGTSRIWNVSSGACERVLTGSFSGRVYSVAWPSKNVVVSSLDNAIQLWNVDKEECKLLLEDTGTVVDIAVSPDGSKLACGLLKNSFTKNSISLWDMNSGRRIGVLTGHANNVYGVAWSRDRIVSASTDRSIRIWDATAVVDSNFDNPEQFSAQEEPTWINGRSRRDRHTSRVNRVSFSDDGHFVATASSDCTIRIWDPDTGECVRVLNASRCPLRTVAWSRDSKMLVSGAFDGDACIWDAATGDRKSVLRGHTEQVVGVKFCNHGSSRVCTGARDGTMRIWNVATGECKLILEGHEGWVNSVAWSNDDSKVASGSNDTTIRIWDATSGKCLLVLEGHLAYVYSVRWSQDGSNLVSRSNDETVRIWDPTNGECKEVINALNFKNPALECDRFYKDRNRACAIHYDQSVNFYVEKD